MNRRSMISVLLLCAALATAVVASGCTLRMAGSVTLDTHTVYEGELEAQP